MKKLMKAIWLKPLVLYMVLASIILAGIPKDSLAYMVQSRQETFSREDDLGKVQRVLESKIVAQRLSELGLSMDEINRRVVALPDRDLHTFASNIDSLYGGGGAMGVTIGLLIIVVLVMLILQMSGKKIIIK